MSYPSTIELLLVLHRNSQYWMLTLQYCPTIVAYSLCPPSSTPHRITAQYYREYISPVAIEQNDCQLYTKQQKATIQHKRALIFFFLFFLSIRWALKSAKKNNTMLFSAVQGRFSPSLLLLDSSQERFLSANAR